MFWFTARIYASTAEKTKEVFPLAEIMLSSLEKWFLQRKHVSTSWKYVCTTEKNSICRPKSVFPLARNMFRIAAKNFFRGRNVFPLVGDLFQIL